jgi:PAS domain S-box-containing protein
LLCVAGYDGYLKKINPAVSKLLGYTNEELLSKPINDLYFADQKALLQLEMILEGVFI